MPRDARFLERLLRGGLVRGSGPPIGLPLGITQRRVFARGDQHHARLAVGIDRVGKGGDLANGRNPVGVGGTPFAQLPAILNRQNAASLRRATRIGSYRGVWCARRSA